MHFSQGNIASELLAEIAEEVAFVEAELETQSVSAVRLVADISRHTLSAGGKRLRPAFVTLAAKATGLPYDPIRARKVGACMEMIHMATLIHDDVIDRSDTRRGRPTASSLYGNTGSILSGDVLLAKAMVLLAQDGDLDIIRTVSQMVVEMAEGEVRELEVRGCFELTESDHLEVLRMKTASFIQCCCEAGAMLAGAPADVRKAVGTYGHHVGIAFQIVDDLLDYRGDKKRTGKPVATDFREGQATLPLILLRPLLSEQEREAIGKIFGNGVTDDEIRMLTDWMDTRGAFDLSEKAARAHVDKALEALASVPSNGSNELLASVAEYVLARQA